MSDLEEAFQKIAQEEAAAYISKPTDDQRQPISPADKAFLLAGLRVVLMGDVFGGIARRFGHRLSASLRLEDSADIASLRIAANEVAALLDVVANAQLPKG